MNFYDASTNQGICQEIDRLCDTSDTSYTRTAKTSRVNNALEQVIGWLIQVDGTWQFDDTNYTSLPIGTSTLVEGQTSYSFTDKFLSIEEVDILSTGGQYVRLTPIDTKELGGQSVEEYFGITSTTPKGMPTHYDKQANNIKLYPAPAAASVTLAAGLRVRFKRTASLFSVVGTDASPSTAADTTVPGFASPYHIILAYMAALPYCMSYKKDRVALYQAKILELKDELTKQKANAEEDKDHIITVRKISFR